MAYRILSDQCSACGTCVDICPAEAIIEDGDVFKIDTDICESCGSCIDECPSEAIVEED